jgi:hypothetical protein
MQNDPQAALIESARRLRNRIAVQRSCDDFAVDHDRRTRALQTCHRFKAAERPRHPAPRASNAYVPELAARIDDDLNLTDGARRCGRKIAELTYRQNREGRSLPVTVTYLARALGRCRRTVQRYLRQLEDEGYIAVDVVAGARSRMCVGLVVRLLAPLLAAHHRERWPGALGKPGATPESQNQSSRVKLIVDGIQEDRKASEEGQKFWRARCIPVTTWAQRCMNGVFNSLMKTSPLAGLPPVLAA